MVTHETNARNSLANGVTSLLDASGTNATAQCQILDGTGTVLVNIPLQLPSFAPASDGTIVLNGMPNAVANVAGNAASFKMLDRSNNVVYQGKVDTISGDMLINVISIAVGQKVTITSHSYTAPQ